MLRSIVVTSIFFNVCLLLGRFSGFIREFLLAKIFGASVSSDIIILLLTLPDLITNLLIGGALSATLIPIFSRRPDLIFKYIYQVSISVFLFSVLISIVIYIYSLEFISLLAPGFSINDTSQANSYLPFILFSMPIAVLTGVSATFLQFKNKFFMLGMGTAIFNGCIILALLFLSYFSITSIYIALCGLVAGIFFRYISQLVFIRYSFTPISSCSPWLLSFSFYKKFLQSLSSGFLLLMFPVFARAFASYEGQGGVALYNFSMKLVELPLLISVTFISTILMPRLSSAFHENPFLYSRLTVYGLQATFVLSLIAMTILISGIEIYVNFVFSGSLNVEDLQTVMKLAKIGLLSIFFQGGCIFISTIHNSAGNTHFPMFINGFGTIVLFTLLSYGGKRYGVEYVMSSVVLTYVLLFIVYCYSLNRSIFDWSFFCKFKYFYLFFILSVILTYIVVLYIQAYLSVFLLLIFIIFSALLLIIISLTLHSESRALLIQKLFRRV